MCEHVRGEGGLIVLLVMVKFVQLNIVGMRLKLHFMLKCVQLLLHSGISIITKHETLQTQEFFCSVLLYNENDTVLVIRINVV